ncbi:MAG TPA: hypothetical protein VMZ91_08125, partial [Candidatus Paceibacterota bacterium]|nr:hypothetical protein [Candidatus Paceibacterota bacterium]
PGVSKYNSAQLINQRMHNLWLECLREWKQGNLEKLNDLLDVVYTELYSDAKKEQRIQIRKLDTNISQMQSTLKSCRNPKEYLKLKARYALEIKHKWLFLKTLEKGQGIGKAYRDEFEDDFD